MRKIDLPPTPQVLTTLGEISLDAWQCLAEFIDNSVDSFLTVIKSEPDTEKQWHIDISLPKKRDEGANVCILDNGPGISDEGEMIKMVRAGYSSRTGQDYLGIWGMGLNVASARLGKKMEIISFSTKDGKQTSIAIEVDLDEMVRNNRFVGNLKTPSKKDKDEFPFETGTIVRVSNLKSEFADRLSRPEEVKRIKEMLGRVYSPMLSSAEPIKLILNINKSNVAGSRLHYWEEKDAPEGKVIYKAINHEGIRGWIGVQKYADESEFGIDFVRNGRKIELNNREDLFYYYEKNGRSKKEYPIDDPRGRGRIIGEIHLDECRVPFAKDRFDRTDPLWNKMLEVVRGGKDFPLRKSTAKIKRGEHNKSPLGEIYNDFRRGQPSGTSDKEGWLKLRAFPDNDAAFKKLNVAGVNWLAFLEKEVDRHISGKAKSSTAAAKKAKPGTAAAKKQAAKAGKKGFGKKNFPRIYARIDEIAEANPYIYQIILEMNELKADKTPIASCICLRALVEIALKSKVEELLDEETAKSLLQNKSGQEAGLGGLLSNLNEVYNSKKGKGVVFNDFEIDRVARAFAKKAPKYVHFLNSVTHGNIIAGETHADSFAKQCAALITALLVPQSGKKK